ncbi:unnamed protein product [Cuscuta epithymum]|uniref:Uncharacterized protein n=1 Tax=Cuscuta epithymum TaxID=186058 RepID=A0AAV0CV80_9ASTE|nr:unnamed protein product [Cuscuta epithymum]
MASAVLASRNESSWAQSGDAGAGFMGKTPYSHTHLNPNPNPSSNPKKKQKHFHQTASGRAFDDSPVVTQTASDDAYSFNQRPIESNGPNFGGYLTFNIPSYSKLELNELRKRLVSELEQIRNLKDRIESGHLSTTVNHNPRSNVKSKKSSGNKRSVPSGSNKDLKKFCNGVDNNRNAGVGGAISGIDLENMMKDCRQVLAKLMKHKSSWIFNTPVDAAALGLHDYHQIVKNPMDLGTVKSNLAKDFYRSPSQFAADVRLTFNNALLYNPKTDQVHGWADQLLSRFEELFRPIQEKLNRIECERRDFISAADELQGSSWNQDIPSPERGAKMPKAMTSPIRQVSKKQERFSNHSSASTPSAPPPPPPNPPPRQQSPIRTPSPVRAPPVMPTTRGTMPKQPKPKAKDPNKREMQMEEKHKLGMELQNLPEEKMPQLVQIIRKRNEHLAQDGDEIELDIEALDTETLWELDRFVTNWKKLVSKTKRQALLGNLSGQTPSVSGAVTSNIDGDGDGCGLSEKIDSPRKPKKGEAGDEDVDIDDDDDDNKPAASFPLIEIEKDEGGGGREPDNGSSSSSSSGSSSSDSSSSSGSDSGSSGSDSDADDAQS